MVVAVALCLLFSSGFRHDRRPRVSYARGIIIRLPTPTHRYAPRPFVLAAAAAPAFATVYMTAPVGFLHHYLPGSSEAEIENVFNSITGTLPAFGTPERDGINVRSYAPCMSSSNPLTLFISL